ncbi:4-hydroxy-tetrahydrodipicolinate synthase [Kineococcus radiotolerans]|uniref:4-hydroxy-tetrahydrodipicolinate synthase n=1 Tax=Kineococcus radiotolerans TaxID=131568 RepID=A0A7W4TJW1_KINRA|nr:4-hydroxy-tetrahydrodipicolinate synthase [Kineococcus radiotolerans]MBB2899832.1 4-hydroxy-tetrahydrodipicolinate synthase [Kineococcus radiotolerans]
MPTATAAQPPRPFGTVLSAVVTPFTASGAVDLDAAAALAVHLVEHGHDGLVVSGTTGESPTTSDEEKDRLLRAVLDAVGDRAHVLAGVGTNDTAHTLELARAAEKAGAHGLLVVTPYYNKPPQAALAHHFTTVADGTGLPVMLYDIPGRSGVPIETETLVRVAEHERIVAVKDAKGDSWGTSWVLARTELAYYSGDDAVNLPLLAQGASGIVSVVSHVAGREYAAMVAAVDAGDLVTARAIHTRLLPAVRGIMTRTQGVVAVKAALELTGVLSGRAVRPPLLPATPEEVAALAADLALAGLAPAPLDA